MSGWTVVYDGDCAFCRRCVRWLARWDRAARLAFVPFQDERALATLPPIPPAALTEAMHLVAPDGSVRAGAAAAPSILRLLPGGHPLALLFRVPGVPFLAARVYRAVARRRHQLAFGERTACGADQSGGYIARPRREPTR